MSNFPKCACGYLPKTLTGQTRHINKCEAFLNFLYEPRAAGPVKDTNEDLRGNKRRRVELEASTPVSANKDLAMLESHAVADANGPQKHTTGGGSDPDIGPNSRRSYSKHDSELPTQTMYKKSGSSRDQYDEKSRYPSTGSKSNARPNTPVAPPLPASSEYYPFSNYSQYLLAKWFETAAESGTLSFDHLLACFRDPMFKKEDCDMDGFSYDRMLELLNSVNVYERTP